MTMLGTFLKPMNREGVTFVGIFGVVSLGLGLLWLPAGTLPYRTRDVAPYRGSGRWEFEGHVASDVRDRYVGYSVGKGGQNPIRYVNC